MCGASPPAIFHEASETGGRTGFCRIETVYRILAARASRNEKAAVVKAVLTDSKISRGLYDALGYEVSKLKRTISAEVSRGIASSLSYADIARNQRNASKLPLSNANRIVRTEGHRIQQASTMDAQRTAKAKGADVVKQWDATLDGRTRPTHRLLDGQIRELDEQFEVGGKKVAAPGYFGDPAEDCNCRCTSNTRAKWALDEEELETLRERARYHGLLVDDSKAFGHAKAKDFADFKQKYMKTTSDILEISANSSKIEINELTPCLRRLRDGKIIETEVVDVSPTKKMFSDWEFDWTIPKKNGFAVRGIKAVGDDRIQGLVALKPDSKNYAVYIDIVESAPFNNPHNKKYVSKEYAGVGGHLFAEAVRESINQGFGGFVYFKAKANLIDHYQKELGAVLVNPKVSMMAIDERSAKILYDQYYKGK